MVLTRLREYWEMENLDFSNFTEVDINSLGTFLRGLAQDELKKLPEKILLTAIRRLGEETGLPEDKLKARAYLAVELFKVNFKNTKYKRHTDPNGGYDQNCIKRNKGLNYIAVS